ncbi:hypothetical protein Tco_1366228 [Tanacetum coccineum]
MVYMVKDKCDDGLVIKAIRGTESKMKDECSNSGNDTHAEGLDIRLSNGTKPLHEVQSTVAYNEDANDRHHAEQPKFINEGKVDQELKDVSNESKTADTVYNDAFEVTQDLSTRIHKSRENNSLTTLQKENENFMASLQIENAHLKQTYKDLYESVQRSKAESNQCDEVKVKVNFDEIETKNIELEHRVSSLLKDNEHLKLVYKNLFDSIKKTRVQKENLRATLSEFSVNHIFGKEDSSPSSTNELEKESGENICDNAKCEFQTKFVELEKVLTQQTKDFDDVKLELSNRTAKFEAYFEKLEKTKVVLERQLAQYHELRTSYNALKVKFDSLNRKQWNINVSKSSKPKVSVSEKVHTGESSKPFSRRVSQFTTYSLQKDRKFSKTPQSFETLTPQKGFMTRASNAKHQSFKTLHFCFTPVKQVWRPIKESQTFGASTSQKSFKPSTLNGKNQVFVTPSSHFTPVKQVWRPKQSHSKSFKYSKSEMLSMQNKNDSASTINKKGRFSNDAKTNFQNVLSNDNNKWKSFSSTRFKTPHETPSFKNQWSIKRNFKSPLIPRELFSNETPVSSPHWNSTSLHRLDTTFNWFSKFGKPVSTVLKWVPKVVV